MSTELGRDALLDAFDKIGRAAAKAGTKLQIAVYGYFPISAASSEKQRVLLKNMNPLGAADAPKYPR
jgi:hypothetical protein